MAKPTQLTIPAACPLCGARPATTRDRASERLYVECSDLCGWARRLPDVTGPVVFIPYDGGVDA